MDVPTTFIEIMVLSGKVLITYIPKCIQTHKYCGPYNELKIINDNNSIIEVLFMKLHQNLLKDSMI
jgi:hypothetical protein